MEENSRANLDKIGLLCIGELVKSEELEFYVGPYQRGYRWGESHINYLLNDIWDSPRDKKYCLQPITVLKMPDKPSNWELIDGQQRLTTIYLILSFLSKEFYGLKESNVYKLEYDTRESTAYFLKTIDGVIRKWLDEEIEGDDLMLWSSFQEKYGESNKIENNIDNYHLFHAYLIINKWFKHKSLKNDAEEFAEKFHEKLLDQTQVIWYPAQENGNKMSAEDRFMNINANKITLNDAELIKALFIYDIQKGDEALDIKEFKKKKFANEWDQIENELHNDELWFFINNKKADKYETRIGKLLDIRADKESSEELSAYYSFDKNKKLHNWESIKNLFNRVKEWYEDIETYHRVGFIINAGFSNLKALLKETKGKKKSMIKSYLEDFIKDKLSIERSKDKQKMLRFDLQNLNYEDKPEDCQTILLLYNVLLIEQTFPGHRFPFNLYQEKNWTLEHIHPQNPKDVETIKAWLGDFRKNAEELLDDEVIVKIDELLINLKNETEKTLSKAIKDEIKQFVEDYKDMFELHSIGNLVLLDGETNSSISNNTFLNKRSRILVIEKDKNKYIPLGTLHCFMKKTTPVESLNMEFWSHKDILYYTENIATVLIDYLPKTKER